MTSAEYRALHQKGPAKPSAAAPQGKTSPAPVGGREGTKEELTAKPCPVRWNIASGLFKQQHPGMERVVVVCHSQDLPAVVAALTELTS